MSEAPSAAPSDAAARRGRSNPPRLAVVGAGMHSTRSLLPAVAQLHGEQALSAVAVSDLDEARARAAAETVGFANVFTSHQSLLDWGQFDCVLIVVPSQVTADLACFFLDHGTPTMMEKPPGASSDDTRRIVASAGSSGAINMVAFNRRHMTIMQQARRLTTETGPIRQVICEFTRCHRRPPRQLCGSGLHGLDAMRFFGGDVVEVVTRQASLGPTGADVAATLTFAGGATGSFTMTYRGGANIERYVVHAHNATSDVSVPMPWSIDPPGVLHHWHMGQRLTLDNNDCDPRLKSLAFLAGFRHEIEHFVENVAARQPCTPDAADALESMLLAEAVQAGESKKL